jgi:predicted amidophosphoribosyltransferase
MAAWKKSQDRSIAWLFARLLEGPLSELYAQEGRALAIVPVPPRPGKVAEIGWDQIEDLSIELAGRYSLPVSRCLIRQSAIEQKGLGKEARVDNARGSMKTVRGSRIPASACVIDDVMTTGSTIDSCAYALKEAGCRTVRAITLFFD